MSTISQLASDTSNYLKDEVSLSITNLSYVTGDPLAINVNEIWKCKVTVTNNGHLDMTDVQIVVKGERGTLIGVNQLAVIMPAAGFTTKFTVYAQTSVSTPYYIYFKAPSNALPHGPLIKAHISHWNASLTHITHGHSDEDQTVVGTYSDDVLLG